MGLEKVIGKLTPLLLAGSISFSNCGKGEENSNGSCQDDWDCPGEEYCVNGYCQGDDSNGSGGNGNSNPDDTPSSSGYPQTPQALFDDFLDTLGEDVDGAVTTYIDAAVQKKYLNPFTQKSNGDLQYMINQMKDATLIPDKEGTQFREYHVLLSDGVEYPVQMLLVKESGKKVWKIRGI